MLEEEYVWFSLGWGLFLGNELWSVGDIES